MSRKKKNQKRDQRGRFAGAISPKDQASFHEPSQPWDDFTFVAMEQMRDDNGGSGSADLSHSTERTNTLPPPVETIVNEIDQAIKEKAAENPELTEKIKGMPLWLKIALVIGAVLILKKMLK